MNALRILDIFKRMYSPRVKSHAKFNLGRWHIHNDSQTMLKIKYANEDNCGLSSHNKNIKQVHQNNELDEKYIYMMGYESAHK